jgi:hypothetical protein
VAVIDPDELRRRKQARSVEHLQELYSVVVAIALSLVVARLIPGSRVGVVHRPLLLAGALLVTLIPFYHGALRHLDEQYTQPTDRPPHDFGVLVDFLLLFLESCAFLALAVSIGRPRVFTGVYLLLLALDVVWAYVTTTFLIRADGLHAQESWLYVNLITAAIVAVLLALGLTGVMSSQALWYAIPAIALLRTTFDYKLAWRFYAAVENA